jgi:non-ribosomal peptide synthetase component F
MSREVRMVPANWVHPKQSNGRFQPMHDQNYTERLAEWEAEKAKWDSGDFPEWGSEDNRKLTYEEWDGEAPKPENYMPSFKPEEKTHYMMYETTTEGTPISPAFATKEELAHWLTDTGASAFGATTATYEQWLTTINRGWAMSAVSIKGEVVSGVVALSK